MAPLRTNLAAIKREQQRQLQEREWFKALPLPIRKAIKARDNALGACGAAAVEIGTQWTPENRERYNALRSSYETLRDQVEQMLVEHKGA